MAQESAASLEYSDEPLSEPEPEILGYLVEGLTDREIANCLRLAPRTIKWYNSQLYRKLGGSNRREAAQRAHALGLLHRDEDTADSTARHNLTARTTPSIGRQFELQSIAWLIADPPRCGFSRQVALLIRS